MTSALKKLVEIAVAREFSKVATLRSITPKIWDSDATVKQPFLNIQATSNGEDMAWPAGVYMVDITVRIEGTPRRGMNLSEKMAAVELVFQQVARLDKPGLEARFANTGIYIYGAIPRQLPAAIEGSNRVDMSACAFVACLA